MLVRRCVYISLLAHVIAAWFNTGYYHPDEHFHILEFLNARLGWSDPAGLPWEWSRQMRPAVLVLYGAVIAKPMIAMGFYDPHVLAFLLRLTAAFLGMYASWLLLRCTADEDFGLERTDVVRVQSLWIAALWVLPLMHARYSVDSISGSLLFIGACLLIYRRKVFSGGLLLAAGSVLRPHFAPMAAAVLVWWQVQDTSRWKYWPALFCAAVVAVLAEVLSAYWLYGNWVFTPWAYFDAIFLDDQIARFEAMPWWGYFQLAIDDILIPFGVLFIAALTVFAVRFPRHWLTAAIAAVLVFHFIAEHKNIRFLAPLVTALPVMSLALYKPAWRTWHKGALVMSAIVLPFALLSPMHRSADFAGFMNAQYNNPKTLYSLDADPYEEVGLRMHFYDQTGVTTHLVDEQELMNLNGPFLFFQRRFHLSPVLTEHTCQPIYSSMPEWVGTLDFNNWLDRSEVWRLYTCSK